MKVAIKRLAMLATTLALALSALPAGLVPARADDFPYIYVEIPLGAGRLNGAALAVNSSGIITGAYLSGYAWISDNGGPVQFLGSLGGSSWGRGINDNVDVVGNSYVNDSSEPPHAFLYHDGVMVDLGTGYAHRGSSSAMGVNNNLQVVGENFAPGEFTPHAILWQDGQMTDLGTLGGTTASAWGINDSGQIVGEAQTSVGWHHAFVWQDGQMTDLGTLGSFNAGSYARAINSQGLVAGYAQSTGSSPSHATIWKTDGTILDLGTLPGRSQSFAYALNGSSAVVGLSRQYDNHAFIWQDGVMQDLNDLAQLPPHVTLAVAFGISDTGVIVGQTCNFNEECPGDVSPRAYALIPNPGGGAGRSHLKAAR